MDILESDFYQLKEQVQFPYDFEPNFMKINELANPNILAQTLYGKKLGDHVLPPYIEFSEKYFDYNDSERLIILLHEIIHAYQRQDALLDFNNKLRELLKKFATIISEKWTAEKLKNSENQDEKEVAVLDKKFKSLKSVCEIPYEIWDDIYFKTNYEQFFIQNMSMNYNNVSRYLPQIKKFVGIPLKYGMYKEILRTKYLSELNQGYPLEENFTTLHNEWIKEFQSKFSSDETTSLNEKIRDLTKISDYPDPTNLIQHYIEFATFVWGKNEK